ncbi:MAG: DUF5660 domain-containing protein [Candidatus Gottesmanbacteria bacterium]|nr:DUF5660 domain-containing protein [Candidatus Gottesmanbacteria bacterium]
MQPLQANQTSQPKKQSANTTNSVLESLRDLGSGVGNTITKDVIGGMANDALSSLFGQPTGGDFKRPQQPTVEGFPERQPFRPQMRRPEVYQPMILDQREEVGMKQKLDSVRLELKALASSIKNLNSQIERAIDDIPAHAGIYHVNFLERLRGIIRTLRENIEDSGSWLALWSGRKQKKKYWGMYKKHGTSFGLSSERNVSTQAG